MIKLKKIKPMFSGVLTTAEKYEMEQTKDGLVETDKQVGSIKELQKVISVGDMVRGIKVGDTVCFNPERFAVKMHKDGSLNDGVIQDNQVKYYQFPIIDVDDKECMLLEDRDIIYVVEDFEETSDEVII